MERIQNTGGDTAFERVLIKEEKQTTHSNSYRLGQWEGEGFSVDCSYFSKLK